MLSGCASSPATSASQPAPNSVAVPETRLVDYLTTRCSDIWHIENTAALANPFTGCAVLTAPNDFRPRKPAPRRTAGQ